MLLIIMIKTLMLQYDSGMVWCSVDEIIIFLTLISISIIALPFAILGDILFMPMSILIFIIRKHDEKKYFKRKYTLLKDFINEVGE